MNKKDNERIGEGNEKSRYAIVYQCTLCFTAKMNLLRGVRLETVYPKKHQEYASQNLERKKCTRSRNEVHDETHAITRN